MQDISAKTVETIAGRELVYRSVDSVGGSGCALHHILSEKLSLPRHIIPAQNPF